MIFFDTFPWFCYDFPLAGRESYVLPILLLIFSWSFNVFFPFANKENVATSLNILLPSEHNGAHYSQQVLLTKRVQWRTLLYQASTMAHSSVYQASTMAHITLNRF